jgi:hypothetical protein
MQWREVAIVASIFVGAVFEKQLDDIFVGRADDCQMQRGFIRVVARVHVGTAV